MASTMKARSLHAARLPGFRTTVGRSAWRPAGTRSAFCETGASCCAAAFGPAASVLLLSGSILLKADTPSALLTVGLARRLPAPRIAQRRHILVILRASFGFDPRQPNAATRLLQRRARPLRPAQ